MTPTATPEITNASDGKRLTERPVIRLWSYVVEARIGVAVTAPLVYGCFFAFAFLDASISLYQAVCFPIYEIPKARRGDYMRFDRAKLRYLNLLERFNCLYCSYANGVIAFATEVAARTEQHWCPIRHNERPRRAHDRYDHFLPYHDEEAYRKRSESVRQDFSDLG